MAIKKHNLGLVPSSWYRWMLFCKLICQEPSKLSEHYSEDLLNRMFSELVKELSSSRITYMPYEVTDDSSTDSLKGLGYFAGLLSKQTEKIVPYFPAARNELNNIISDLNFAKNITEFAESHLFPGLEWRHENLAYDVDNRTFTFFPPLNQLWEKLQTEWNILNLPGDAEPYSAYELFQISVGELNSVWRLEYEEVPADVNLLLRPFPNKTISFYSLIASLTLCSNYHNEKKEWWSLMKEHIDWTNYPIDWSSYFLIDSNSGLSSIPAGSLDTKFLSQFFARSVCAEAVSPTYLIETKGKALSLSLKKIWRKIREMSDDTPELLSSLKDCICSELEYFRNNQSAISTSFITPSQEQELRFVQDYFFLELVDADAWFDYNEVMNFNADESFMQLKEWVLRFSEAVFLPHDISINSDVVESIIDIYIKDDLLALNLIDDELALNVPSQEETFECNDDEQISSHNITSFPKKTLSETLGPELYSSMSREFLKHCNENCEVFPGHKTKLIKLLLDTELYHPKNGWEKYLRSILSNVIPLNEQSDSRYSATICKLSALQKYKSDIFKVDEFNYEDFNTKYLFFEVNIDGSRSAIMADSFYRILKDNKTYLPNIAMDKILKYLVK